MNSNAEIYAYNKLAVGVTQGGSVACSIPNTGVDTLVTPWDAAGAQGQGVTWDTLGTFTITERGIYIVSASVVWTAAVVLPKLRIYLSGSPLGTGLNDAGVTTTGANYRPNVTGQAWCGVGYTIDIRMAHTSAAAVTVTTRGISIVKVGNI